MEAVLINVYFDTIFNTNMLINDGWEKYDDNIYKKYKDNYVLTYKVNFIRGSNISVSLTTEEDDYKNFDSFSLVEVWNFLWKKNKEITSIEIYTKEDLLDTLIEYGWEKIDYIPNSNIYMYGDGIELAYSYRIKDGYNILAYEQDFETNDLFIKLKQSGINIENTKTYSLVE